ncbi:hypothetical protein CAEBREN_03637 [Caenorhabditis brenneri]|uniref:Uncharacterized protein n=1 Tax=Caenorhabditis brenneri TaxID=135651 RepID=G0PB91_CAEBE|nr:hypothetical protein CAEBREN_03637 [Caenorhabditis brenneri]
MMGVGAPGEVADMLTLCEPPQCTPDDDTTEWDRTCGMVTAFTGPFEDNPENPSSIILDELEKDGAEHLSFFKLQVSYEEVTKKIPELWKQQFWNFAVHLDPHSVRNRIYIEQRAFSNGYSNPDSLGFTPENGEAPSNMNLPEMKCPKNCEELSREVNEKCGLDGEKYGGLLVEKSEDPGRFVESYMYFISLQQSPWNTILVKVPPLEGECTKEAVASVIREVVKLAFK